MLLMFENLYDAKRPMKNLINQNEVDALSPQQRRENRRSGTAALGQQATLRAISTPAWP
jgi:hypothetical protein